MYDNLWLVLRANGSLPEGPASVSNDCLLYRVQCLAAVEHPGPGPLLPAIRLEGACFRQCAVRWGRPAAGHVLLAGWVVRGLGGRVVESTGPARMSHCRRL